MTTLNDIEAAVAQILVTPINTALANIEANPTTLNAAGQFAALQANLIAVLPALETLGIKDGAALLQEKLNGWVASLTAAPVPSSAPAA